MTTTRGQQAGGPAHKPYDDWNVPGGDARQTGPGRSLVDPAALRELADLDVLPLGRARAEAHQRNGTAMLA